MAAAKQHSSRLESTTSVESVFSKDPSYRHKILRRSGTSIESEDFNPEKETRVLVLYTGGTIGMKVHDGGKILRWLILCSMIDRS